MTRPERLASALALIAAGRSRADTALAVGWKVSSLNKRIHEAGLSRRHATHEIVAEAWEVAAVKGLGEAVLRYGYTAKSLRNAFRRAGLPSLYADAARTSAAHRRAWALRPVGARDRWSEAWDRAVARLMADGLDRETAAERATAACQRRIA